MATQVQVLRSGSWEDVDYSSFSIDIGISTQVVAPTAEFRTRAGEDITAGQDARIRIDGTTVFDGVAETGGTKRPQGMTVALEHPVAELWASTATFTETGPPTDLDVLEAALTNAGTNTTFTISYSGAETTLDSDYEANDRPVDAIFRDMMDRTDRVWWVDPAGTTIHVEPAGDRGTWQSLSPSDGIELRSFDSGSIKTVINDVTVIGTGGLATVGTATDSTSISTYGRRATTINVDYALTQTEADAIAASVLQPDPVPEGTVLVPESVGNVTQSLANYEVDVTDATKDVDATGLVIEKQELRQGRVVLSVGGGTGASVTQANRGAKSDADITRPGSVYDSDRIADNAILASKLEDLAVTTAKLADNAVINGKLDDLSVSETKIQDDSIATPKLQAGAVTANEIEADTITASEIAAGTITALEVATDTLTASEIAANTLTAAEVDTLDLDTTQLSILDGGVGIEFDVVSLQGNTRVSMLPTGDADAHLGSSSSAFDAANIDTVELGNNLIVQSSTGILRPSTDNEGNVGNSFTAWNEVAAHNFTTVSPPPIEGVDPAAVRGADWYDNPPEPVKARARDLGPTDAVVPEGKDHAPVELGTMANWLLEVCKAQQEQIDSLEERISALEQQV